MRKIKRIFIIGHPGAGKGVIAKTVAKKLNWDYIDADFGLEIRIGKNINAVLGNSGVKQWLATQNDILKSLQTKENIVVTTDPSIVLDPENNKLLTSEFSVYVKASVKILLDRIDMPSPLLLDDSMQVFLQKLEKNRNGLYSKSAQLTVDTDEEYFDQHVARILEVII